jgi:hypothetical protein
MIPNGRKTKRKMSKDIPHFCTFCGEQVFPESWIKLQGEVYLHWECFFQHGQIALENNERLIKIRAGDAADCINALVQLVNLLNVDKGNYGDMEAKVAARTRELEQLWDRLSEAIEDPENEVET